MGIIFNGRTNFTHTEFSGVSFLGAQFRAKSTFYRAKFNGETLFLQTIFAAEVHFVGVKFLDEVYFQGTEFKTKTHFDLVYFENGEKILFDVYDLSKVSFLETKITRVKFSANVVWGEYDKFKVIHDKEIEWSIEYLFRWNTIPTNENDVKKLREFLKYIGVRWVNDLQFVKVDEKTIHGAVIEENESVAKTLVMKLDVKKSRIHLLIENDIFYEFIVKRN
jgi:hypothetical protein